MDSDKNRKKERNKMSKIEIDKILSNISILLCSRTKATFLRSLTAERESRLTQAVNHHPLAPSHLPQVPNPTLQMNWSGSSYFMTTVPTLPYMVSGILPNHHSLSSGGEFIFLFNFCIIMGTCMYQKTSYDLQEYTMFDL